MGYLLFGGVFALFWAVILGYLDLPF